MAIDVRQQTDPPSRPPTRLLVVSLAPPFKEVVGRTRADSATNNPDDALRRFLEGALRRRWDELVHSGVALLHAMKCAVVPDSEGFQNPPADVVDLCAPRHLAREIRVLRPTVVATLGRMAYRAVARALAATPGVPHDPEIRLTKPPGAAQEVGNGYTVRLASGASLRLFVGPFIRGGGQDQAKRMIRSAAIAGGVSRPDLLDTGPAQTG
ncbi:MAG: uracil-DNA glycosylase family protein [Candidatus Rokuibacteriota bacterium]